MRGVRGWSGCAAPSRTAEDMMIRWGRDCRLTPAHDTPAPPSVARDRYWVGRMCHAGRQGLAAALRLLAKALSARHALTRAVLSWGLFELESEPPHSEALHVELLAVS